MFRNKKQAVIIFLSFFVALTSFMIVNTLVKTNSAENILNTYYDYDFRVLNETVSSDIVLPYDKKAFGGFLKRVYDSPVAEGDYKKDIELYKKNPEKERFLGKIVAVDQSGFEQINKQLKVQVNARDFFDGKVGIIEPGLGISAKEAVGKNIEFYLSGQSAKEMQSIKIVSEAEKGPNYYAAGIMPDIIVSDVYLKQIKKEPMTELLKIKQN